MKTANFLILFMLAAVCIGMTACTKGDTTQKNKNSLLVGRWSTSESPDTLIFNADGIGYIISLEKEGDIYKGTKDIFSNNKMTYILDDSMLLTITFDKPASGGEKIISLQIKFIDADHFAQGDPAVKYNYTVYTREKPE